MKLLSLILSLLDCSRKDEPEDEGLRISHTVKPIDHKVYNLLDNPYYH